MSLLNGEGRQASLLVGYREIIASSKDTAGIAIKVLGRLQTNDPKRVGYSS
jgi:hypothetical protein